MSKNYQINSKNTSIRSAICMLNSLSRNNNLEVISTYTVDKTTLIKHLNNQITLVAERRKKEVQEIKEELFQDQLNTLVPEEKFEWLLDNDRAIYWLWALIAENKVDFLPKPFANFKWMTHSNSKSRFESIQVYIEHLNSDREEKIQLLNSLYQHWCSIFQSPKPFSWINKNDDVQLNWIWDYMKKYESEHKINTHIFLSHDLKQLYLSIFASYDSWTAPIEAKKLFLININKAWNQKKIRDSRKDKKQYTFVMNKSIQDKLNEVASHENLNKSELMERLINRRHSEIFK